MMVVCHARLLKIHLLEHKVAGKNHALGGMAAAGFNRDLEARGVRISYLDEDQRIENSIEVVKAVGHPAVMVETGIESGARAGGSKACSARRIRGHRNGPMPRLPDER